MLVTTFIQTVLTDKSTEVVMGSNENLLQGIQNPVFTLLQRPTVMKRATVTRLNSMSRTAGHYLL